MSVPAQRMVLVPEDEWNMRHDRAASAAVVPQLHSEDHVNLWEALIFLSRRVRYLERAVEGEE